MGNPVAEVDDQGRMEIDEGNYDPIKIIGEAFPAAAVIDYVVRAGDTLQSIAAQVYGNPSLWFVIADANGLSGAEALKEGMHLKIPNTVQNGRITAETRVLYDEGEIVGSKLPNLKTPPPPQTAQQSASGDNCAVIGAIILIVFVAIVAIAVDHPYCRSFCAGCRRAHRHDLHRSGSRGDHWNNSGRRRGHRLCGIGGNAGDSDRLRLTKGIRLEASRN